MCAYVNSIQQQLGLKITNYLRFIFKSLQIFQVYCKQWKITELVVTVTSWVRQNLQYTRIRLVMPFENELEHKTANYEVHIIIFDIIVNS